MTKKDKARLLNNARPYDFCLEVDSADWDELVEKIYLKLDKAGHFPKRVNRSNQQRDLSILLLNVLKAEQTGYNPYQRISLRTQAYNINRYNPKEISHRGTKRVFDGLTALEYIKENKGYKLARGKPKSTRIKAAKKLKALFDKYSAYDFTVSSCTEQETIIRKDNNKKIEEYTDTTQTSQWRDNLKIINDELHKHWIDLYVEDTELETINDILNREKGKQPVDFTRNQLRRVFNNSSWDQGGRFYHGWWQEIPSEYRAYIHINDKHTFEVDFSGMHPVMIYAKYTGKAYSSDPYTISGPTPNPDRGTWKVIFNVVINSDKRSKAIGAIRRELKDTGLPTKTAYIETLLDALYKTHAPISKAFNSGEGIRLQFIDSQIAEQVMLEFIKQGYAILPVHDSFIIRHGLEEELTDTMKKAFKTITGVSVNTKTAKSFLKITEGKSGTVDKDGMVTDDLELLFADRDTHTQYYKRGKKYGF